MVYRRGVLEWIPDRGDVTRGAEQHAWSATEINCVHADQRRDISGIKYARLHLVVPEGQVVLAVFHETGARPQCLCKA